MPYISKQEVAEIRKELKAALPEFKLSVVKEDYSSVNVAIMSGPLEYPGHLNPERKRDYTQINHHWLRDMYSRDTEWLDVYEKIMKIALKKQETEVMDSDYGRVPTYYFDLSIGKWDKGYICTSPPKETKPESFTDTLKKAVDERKTVYYRNENYQVFKDEKGQYLIKFSFNDHVIGQLFLDNKTLNGQPEDFIIKDKDEIDQMYAELITGIENRKTEGAM